MTGPGFCNGCRGLGFRENTGMCTIHEIPDPQGLVYLPSPKKKWLLFPAMRVC